MTAIMVFIFMPCRSACCSETGTAGVQNRLFARLPGLEHPAKLRKCASGHHEKVLRMCAASQNRAIFIAILSA